MLSLEEQRLLVLARILLAEPRFAVLARLDASLGPRRTAWTVDLFSKRGIGCIVVTDGTAPREAFDAVVEIRPDGGWTSTGIVTGADGVEEER